MHKVSIKGVSLIPLYFKPELIGLSMDKNSKESLSLSLALSPNIMYASTSRRSGKVNQLLNMVGIDV
jgi:hypothetical protein